MCIKPIRERAHAHFLNYFTSQTPLATGLFYTKFHTLICNIVAPYVSILRFKQPATAISCQGTRPPSGFYQHILNFPQAIA